MAAPCAAISSAVASPNRGLPGSTGTPASAAMARARPLSPIAAIVAGSGPIHVKPAWFTASAKAAFSESRP